VKEILENGADVEARAKGGSRSALTYAAYRGHKDVVKLLLDKGACVQCGNVPLIWSVRGGNPQVVKLLLDKGASVDRRDSRGYTALIWAAALGWTEVAELLLERGADINASSRSGHTALHFAAANGHREVVDLLLNQSADVNARDDAGATPLMNAADSPHCSLEITQTLLDHGADVNAYSPDGWTPLMSASASGRVGLVTLLLDRGARVDARNKLNSTALRTAVSNRQGEVALVLIRHEIYRFLARMRCELLGEAGTYDDKGPELLGSSSQRTAIHEIGTDRRNLQ
jgi:ankyrin repeat protein